MSTTPFPEVRLYEPGRDVTAEATAAVTLKKFVKIAGGNGLASSRWVQKCAHRKDLQK